MCNLPRHDKLIVLRTPAECCPNPQSTVGRIAPQDSRSPLNAEKQPYPFAHPPERLLTARQIATLYNIPVWKLRRFIKTGAVPLYRVGNGRILLRASEFIAAVEAAAKKGGV